MGLWGWLFGRKKAPFEQEWDGETEHEHGIRQLRRQTADTIKRGPVINAGFPIKRPSGRL
jgi:hypothetical protein